MAALLHVRSNYVRSWSVGGQSLVWENPRAGVCVQTICQQRVVIGDGAKGARETLNVPWTRAWLIVAEADLSIAHDLRHGEARKAGNELSSRGRRELDLSSRRPRCCNER